MKIFFEGYWGGRVTWRRLGLREGAFTF